MDEHLLRKSDIELFTQNLGLESPSLNFHFYPTRESLIEYYGHECCQHGLILAYETEKSREFTWISCLADFNQLLLLYSPYKRRFHELVPLDHPHKIYFDLDWKNITMETAVSNLFKLKLAIISVLSLDVNFLIYHCIYTDKLSFHIIVNDYLSPYYSETLSIAKRVAEKVDFPIDLQVYKPWQTFRTPYSVKLGKEIPLIPFDEYTLNAPVTQALVTCTVGCKMLKPKSSPPKKTLLNYKEKPHEYESFSGLDVFLQQFILDNKLSFQKSQGPFIVLKNNFGFSCPRCKEIHHHVHPYIHITDTAYLFSCRQASPTVIKQRCTISASFN